MLHYRRSYLFSDVLRIWCPPCQRRCPWSSVQSLLSKRNRDERPQMCVALVLRSTWYLQSLTPCWTCASRMLYSITKTALKQNVILKTSCATGDENFIKLMKFSSPVAQKSFQDDNFRWSQLRQCRKKWHFRLSACSSSPCNSFPWWRHQWKYFPRYWPFVWGIHRAPVNSPHKGQ